MGPDESDRAIRAAAHLVSTLSGSVASISKERISFTGEVPYAVADLMALLPDGVDAEEEAIPDGVTLLVIGMDEFSEDLIASAASLQEPPRMVPQEGFLDEALFGYDWWTDAVDTLNMFLGWHPGLQFARSLASAGFQWPSTAAEETAGSAADSVDFQTATPLFQLGYRITGLSRTQRWAVLTSIAIPQLGLQATAETIAYNARLRKRQRRGRVRYAHAIGEWEHDLGRLYAEHYLRGDRGFRWPSADG